VVVLTNAPVQPKMDIALEVMVENLIWVEQRVEIAEQLEEIETSIGTEIETETVIETAVGVVKGVAIVEQSPTTPEQTVEIRAVHPRLKVARVVESLTSKMSSSKAGELWHPATSSTFSFRPVSRQPRRICPPTPVAR